MSKEEKVQVADVSLSEADPLSEWHLLSEAYNSLSGLENPRRGLVWDVIVVRSKNLFNNILWC